MKKAGKKSTLIFSAVMLVLCGLLCLIPSSHTNPSSSIPRERVRVDAVDQFPARPLGYRLFRRPELQVTVLTGPYAGQTAQASNYKTPPWTRTS